MTLMRAGIAVDANGISVALHLAGELLRLGQCVDELKVEAAAAGRSLKQR